VDLVTRSRRAATIVALATFAMPVHADPVDRWMPYIAEAARRFAVPVPLLRAVMRAESGGRATIDGQPTVSSAGAMGLMQLMPATWQELRVRYRLGNDAHDPRDNVLAGAGYLANLLTRYGEPLAIAAYHAGPGRVEAHVASGVALPPATIEHVAVVLEHGGRWTAARQAGVADRRSATSPVLVTLSETSSASRQSARGPTTREPLFVPLSGAR
jgi:soluble lytic murein transglycosylase-like protein